LALPVYTDKAATDASFERLATTLFEAGERVYPMIASHNLAFPGIHAGAGARAEAHGRQLGSAVLYGWPTRSPQP